MKTLFAGLIVSALMTTALPAQEGKGVVNRRMENQQDRIQAGEKNGKLTTAEANRLEHKDANIAAEVARDRVNHDGHLTPAERAKVNRQQNRVSGKIFNAKHDGPGK